MLQLRRSFLLGLLPSAFSKPLNNRDPGSQVPVLAGPVPQIFPCTATLDVTPQPCSTGPPISYAATETLYKEVDCVGCLDVTLQTTSEACPAPTEVPEEVDETTTEWEVVCSPTPTLPIHARELAPRQDTCSTTLMLPVPIMGVTATVFKEYVTVTSRLPCGGCELVTSTVVGGLGPIIPPGATVTADVGTRTRYACSA